MSPVTLQWNSSEGSTGPYTVFAIPVAPYANGPISTGLIAHPTSFDGSTGNEITIQFPWTSRTTGAFLVTIMDGSGNYGGVSGRWFPITSNDDRFQGGCGDPNHPDGIATTSDSFHLAVDKTNITTCDGVGIGLYGGTPPYTVTIVGEGSPGPLNKTLNGTDSFYRWIPEPIATSGRYGSHIIMYATDSRNLTTVATPFLELNVNASVKCNEVSSSSPIIPIDFMSGPKPAPPLASTMPTSQQSHISTGAIIGIVVGSLAGWIVLVLAVVFKLVRRRRQPSGGPTPVLPVYSSTEPPTYSEVSLAKGTSVESMGGMST